MSARAQHRQQQQRANQRGKHATNRENDKVRNRRVRIENGRCVGANAEEGCAGKIQHAGITKLYVQAERCHGVEQDRDDQQQNEMILVKEDGDGERRENSAAGERILVIHEGAARAVEQPQPCRGKHGGNAGRKQRNDECLIFRGEQRDQVDSRSRERSETRP